jgi:uncharacterized protein (DUF362 family)
MTTESEKMKKPGRRAFLRLAAAASGGAALAAAAGACGLSTFAGQTPATITAEAASTAGAVDMAVSETLAAITQTAAAMHAAATPAATQTPVPSLTPLPPTLTATADPRPAVALARAADYNLATLVPALQTALDGLGGLSKVLPKGGKVVIKVNLTGGAVWVRKNQPPPTEVYLSHPAVVQALCQLLIDSGAGQIAIVEGIVEEESWDAFGYRAAAQNVGAQLVDLNFPAPANGFTRLPVGEGAHNYEEFKLNSLLAEADLFISVPKMKPHYTAGVTLALKNLVGITPVSLYRNKPEHTYRSALHGGFQDGIDRRLIRSVLDLMRARPVQLAVIDGIWTCEGGEAPWQKGMQALRPGVLAASFDPVAADSVATALMGFDPAAADRSSPFLRSENYLRLAEEQGSGISRLEGIRVVGESIETLRMPFKPVE